jgi:WD40 repeat protein
MGHQKQKDVMKSQRKMATIVIMPLMTSLVICLGTILTGCVLTDSARKVNADNATPSAISPGPGFLRAMKSSAKVTGHNGEVLGLYPCAAPTPFALLSLDGKGRVLGWTRKGQPPQLIDETGIAASAGVIDKSCSRLALAKPGLIWIKEGSGATHELTDLPYRITSLSFDSVPGVLLIGSSDGGVYRWKYAQLESARSIRERQTTLERYVGHPHIINAVAPYPLVRGASTGLFFSADWGGMVLGWKAYDADVYGGEYDRNKNFGGRFFVEPGASRSFPRKEPTPVEKILLVPEQSALLAITSTSAIEWWDIRGPQWRSSTPAHRGPVYDAALNSRQSRLATVGRDGMLRIWSFNLEEESVQLVRESESIGTKRLAFLGEKELVLATQEGTLKFVSIE